MAESDPSELNIGIRLYQKGIKKLEEKERFCKQAKDIYEKQEVEGLEFKPVLVSKQHRDKSQNNNTSTMGRTKREEELISYGKMINERKEKARVELQHIQENQYDHQPKINKKSAKIMQEKTQYMHNYIP